MGYVAKQLSDDEEIVFATTLHPVILVGPVLASAITVALALVVREPLTVTMLLAAAAIALVNTWIRFVSSEFAVTNRRLIIKVGFLSRRAMETMLTKVEGVQVDQSLLGCILDYGTVEVTGAAVGHRFAMIRRPLVFRQMVQDGASESRMAAPRGHLAPLGDIDLPYDGSLWSGFVGRGN